MLQSWQRELDESGYVGTVLMDLCKADNCIPHELLIAKLEVYGLHKNSLNVIADYLSGRKQRTKIGSVFSEWWKIICGIPQGSILGPLLFNIFIIGLFFLVLKCDICNFVDDNTIYSYNKLLSKILANLQLDLNVLTWFTVNSLSPNLGKFQYMILGKCITNQLSLFINAIKIERTSEVVLLGTTIDDQLTFKTHIEYICRMAKYKLRTLQRIRNYLSTEKARLLATAFINSQFYYAPLIWMFAGKSLISKVQKIHFRTLQVLYNTYGKSYNELLILNRGISIHQKHLHFLATEVYKSVNNLNPQFMWNYFNISSLPYELRKGNKENLPETGTCRYGINSLLFRGALLWNNLPRNVKESHSVAEFKEKIKEIGNLTCSGAVCR